jgi:hypothetical protein
MSSEMSSNYFSENNGLFELLPDVIRHRDSLKSGEPLKTTLKEFGAAADRIQKKIESSYANFFVETCGPDELNYLADLIGYRPISGAQRASREDIDVSKTNSEDRPQITLRRDIGRAVWARRRKGTAHVLGDIVHSITGWRSVVFENSRETVATPSIRFAAARSVPGTPDLRRLVGRERVDQGPGLVPRTATIARADSGIGGARWHPLDVVVEGWVKRAELRRNLARKPLGEAYLTFRPDRRDLHLCAPADPRSEMSRTAESVRPIYLSDFWGGEHDRERSRIYGADKALSIFQSTVTPGPANESEIAVDDNQVDAEQITFDRITSRTVATTRWIVDPEQGRMLPPANCFEPVVVRYYESLERDVAADAEDVLRVRLGEHVPMEARAGVIQRS